MNELETLVTLPEEVKELALRVPEVKQKEVQTVLSQIFAGTADWKQQADSIVVKDINDKMSIQLAETGRKNVKTARLAAEKIFDAKRDEVQQKKSEFDLEDKLWLKAKQTAQILFKDIESTFEWKAKFVERYEAEQRELVTQLRIEKVSKFTDDINRIVLENMSDQMFNMFLSGLEKTHNDRITAEKKAEEDRIAKEKAEAEAREAQRLENIRLQKEAAEREKQMAMERKKAEEEREAARKEQERKDRIIAEQNAKAAQDRKEAEERERKLKAEKDRIEAEAKQKEVARLNAIENEKKAKEKAEKAAKLAPDKVKLLIFMQAINDLPRPEVRSIEAANIATSANTLLVKVANYIRENAEKL